MSFVIRLLLTAVALWIATALLSGLTVFGDSTWAKVLSLVVAALVFTVVNTFVKPLVMAIGCALYVLTLGLFGLVVNALMFWLMGWVSDQFEVGIAVDGFWAAFWGAIIVWVAMWVLDLILPRRKGAGR
ncbi:phage holin family protein [Glycomyces arizonensis]|uniref:phage holin family protein n=1 Tax=Glycomyces arizonensis TaxID=256035 RepID=UPI00047B7597|nr:phage holin family protein [Glycomyces arizonensis]